MRKALLLERNGTSVGCATYVAIGLRGNKKQGERDEKIDSDLCVSGSGSDACHSQPSERDRFAG